MSSCHLFSNVMQLSVTFVWCVITVLNMRPVWLQVSAKQRSTVSVPPPPPFRLEKSLDGTRYARNNYPNNKVNEMLRPCFMFSMRLFCSLAPPRPLSSSAQNLSCCVVLCSYMFICPVFCISRLFFLLRKFGLWIFSIKSGLLHTYLIFDFSCF